MDEDKNKKDQEQTPATDLVEATDTNTDATEVVETPAAETESAKTAEEASAEESATTDDETTEPEIAAEESADAGANEATTAIEETTPAADTVEEKTADEADTSTEEVTEDAVDTGTDDVQSEEPAIPDNPNAKWYVVHTASGHENKVSTTLKQRIESEHLEHKILDVLVPTQEKIEIRGGKKGMIKEKIFPGYILVKMVLDDQSWLSVRTTPGVTSFVGIGNKPTPIPEHEVKTIIKYMSQGAAPTYKDVFLVNDTVKIVDGPFSEFIGKVDTVDKEKGKVRVLVSIFGRETPVELDFLQVQKL